MSGKAFTVQENGRKTFQDRYTGTEVMVGCEIPSLTRFGPQASWKAEGLRPHSGGLLYTLAVEILEGVSAR